MSDASPGKPSSELLYDTDTMLRLVDAAIDDLGVDPRNPAARPSAPGGAAASTESTAERLLALSRVLSDGYSSIVHILSTLRRGRGTLEQVAHEKLQPAHAKLQEATSTTEVAATDILDGIERALALVDRLDDAAVRAAPGEAASVRDELRNTLFDVMNHLQFQDITRQQLNFASSVLLDTEHRLDQIAEALEPATGARAAAAPREDPTAGTFDPRATAHQNTERQAVADEVVERELRKRIEG